MPESMNGNGGPAAESLVTVVRRVMQTGRGPAALVSYVRASGGRLTPPAAWTPADEHAARDLARRVADRLAPAGGTVACAAGETVTGSRLRPAGVAA